MTRFRYYVIIAVNMKSPKVTVPKGTPIVVPNQELMSKEEIAKFKKNESQRRLMARRRGKEPAPRTTNQELRKVTNANLVEMATDSRNLVAEVLMKKLLSLLEDDEELKKTNLVHMTTAFGTLVDKVQLLNGLSTENIAIHAKIDINMSSDEAMKELNKMREKYQEQT